MKECFKNKNRNFNMWFRIIIAYLFVISILLTGVTFSRYITMGTGSDEARVASFGNLDLYELDEEGKKTDSINEYKIIPGTEMHKKPVMDFATSKKSEMAVYVFLEVRTKGWQYIATSDSYKIEDGNKNIVLQWNINNTIWKHLTTEGMPGAGSEFKNIYYMELAPGESLSQKEIISGNAISVSDNLLSNEIDDVALATGNIEFAGYAVQLSGFGSPEAAWNAVSAK